MKRFLVLLGLAILCWGALVSSAASAQGGPQVTATDGVNNFPEEVVFRLSAHSEAVIQEVTLHYQILPDGVMAYGRPDFTPAGRVQADFRLRGNDPPRSYLAPGAEIEYFWEIEDAAGGKLTTEPATFVYDDIRFSWESVSDGDVTVYWYAGSRSSAESSLAVARDTLDEMSALLGATVDYPVKVWIYESYQDMLPALPRRSEAHEQRVVVAGMRVASDTILMQGEGADDVLRHELAHIVTHVAGEGPYGGIPTWLDEGTAMYAQSEPGEGYTYPLERAIERDSLLSVRSMTAPTGDPSKVGLFYGQSWSLVKFLIDTYGPTKFAELFAIFKEGSTVDKALLKVYGFDQDGLEDAWRASLGLSPRRTPAPSSTPTPAATPSPAQPSPTPVGSSEEDGDETFPWATAIALGATGFALAGVSLGGGFLLARRLRGR
ncbi:MAG: peptidase MA family metallohydrolase [Dehalococcoidia bacterium]